MAESLLFGEGTREERYKVLLPQISALIDGEPDLVANLSNVSAALRQTFGFFWVGFYIVKDNELVLGPFQGDIACTRIQKGKGVCGSAWQEAKTILVPDVQLFEGHIACSALSQSEIVIPILKENQVVAVLDVDSDQKGDFSLVDQQYLEELALTLSDLF
ncbi:MAG: GAF domain-containing protein [Crocinitomicaceae bacterium]